ncbi:MAG: MATE family efflux transporter [Clostridia bacterium]|nr:MATE family efflux transporter [Clostridia bacterium]
MVKDMTQGNPGKILIKFTIPLLISVCFQQLYNIADSIIAGKFLGGDALASVGISYTVTMIYMAIANGSNIGCCVVISQFFGNKNFSKLKTCVSTSLLSLTILSILLTILGLVFSKGILEALNTPENLFNDASIYLNIYTAGLVFLFLYNVCNGIFTALGDSKTPLYFLIFSSVFNVVLDYVLVKYTPLGISGIAWATFIAQGIASILSFFFLMIRIHKLYSDKATLFSFDILKKIMFVAIPSILQQSFVSVGNIFIQGIVNSFGEIVVAGFSAAGKLNTFTITSMTALGNSMSSYTAQNIGANKIERVKKGVKYLYFISFAITIPLFILFFIFPDLMMKIFVNDNDTEIINCGIEFLKTVAPFYLFISIKLIIDGVLRGSGVMKMFLISTFTDLLLRVMLCYVLSPVLNQRGIWISWPIGWLVATAISCMFYFTGIWKKKINNLAKE